MITGVGVPLGGVSVSVSGATFDSNTNVVAAVDPNSLTALNLGSNYGGSDGARSARTHCCSLA